MIIYSVTLSILIYYSEDIIMHDCTSLLIYKSETRAKQSSKVWINLNDFTKLDDEICTNIKGNKPVWHFFGFLSWYIVIS